MWHAKEVDVVFKELGSSPEGLSTAEAAERLKKFGPNKIKEIPPPGFFQILASQFASPLALILIGAAAIAGVFAKWIDFFAIFAVIVLNALLGAANEYKAEKAIQALKARLVPKARVRRQGQELEISSEELVPGDLLLVEEGTKISADARLVKVWNLRVDEAMLTGESVPSEKFVQALPEKTDLADRENMIYAGTIVTSGRAEGVVTETGMQTEIGKIAHLIETEKPAPTPLQLQLKSFGLVLFVAVVVLAFIIFLAGLAFARPILDMALVAIAMAVALIPEGLPAVFTLCLALGTRAMAAKAALVRKLPSIESLGSCNVICADKTGTLTCGAQTVQAVWCNGEELAVSGVGYSKEGKFSKRVPGLDLLLKIGALCNNAKLKPEDSRLVPVGDPTEAALLISALKAGIDPEQLNKELPRLREIGFTSERKRMTTLHKEKQLLAFSKGAPEVILKRCSHWLVGGKPVRLTSSERDEIAKAAEGFAARALRVLAFAHRELPEDALRWPEDEIERELCFVGLQAMADPPRPGVKEAIEECKKAGIRVIMLTGDHLSTAKAIAAKLGISGKAMTDIELHELSDAQLAQKISEIGVFARIEPVDKVRILKALKAQKTIVAMTGDGVNDAPALKGADIGIAMGITGTDVAKEASEMIIADDNFATIVEAIKEGRRVFDNLRKFILHVFSANFGELLTITISIFSGLPLPLLPIHILLINLFVEGLLGLGLVSEGAEKGIMSRPPRPVHEHIIELPHGIAISLISLVIAVITLGIFFWLDPFTDLAKAQTGAFASLTLLQTFNAFVCRSERQSVFKIGFFKNLKIFLGAGAVLVLLLALVNIPPLQALVKAKALTITEWLVIAALSTSTFFVGELYKLFRK